MRIPKLEPLLYVCNRIIAKIPSHTIRLAFYRHVMEFDIAPTSHVFMDAWFDSNRHFSMGPHSVINQKCRLDTRGGICIGSSVSISAECVILTADHDPQSPTCEARVQPVVIEDYAFLGTRAMILPGVRVGRGAVIAAGAVVTRDVPPMRIYAGVPAREIGTRKADLNYRVDYGRLLF